jgi:hypothetical protein
LIGNGFTTTAEAARWGYARRQRLGSHHYKHMRRALSGIAVKVGRAGGRGRPWLWKARDPGASARASSMNEYPGRIGNINCSTANTLWPQPQCRWELTEAPQKEA